MKCRICGSGSLSLIYQTGSCPKYSHKYLEEKDFGGDAAFPLAVYRCETCSLIQCADDFEEDEYSADYQRNISFSNSAMGHINMFADRLKGLGASNFLEIGCGNGLFSAAMKERGCKVVAFEPSRAACRAAAARGLEVHNRFFDDTIPDGMRGYDSFAMRFVLEHVPDPVGMLRTLHSRCAEGCIGLLEVPNADKQLRMRKWYEFFREHTTYFTPETFTKAAYLAGFELLEMHLTIGDEFITAIVRKGKPPAAEWGEKEFKEKLLGMVKFPGGVWAWGASGGGVAMLCECGITSRHIAYVVDSDSNKHGLFTSGSRIMVVPPSKITASQPGAIIILAYAYEKEIIASIRERGFRGKIGSIFPQPHWIEA